MTYGIEWPRRPAQVVRDWSDTAKDSLNRALSQKYDAIIGVICIHRVQVDYGIAALIGGRVCPRNK